MRLLFITPLFEPVKEAGGGVANSVMSLCEGLARIGDSVTVYTTNASGLDRPLDVPINVPVQLNGFTVYYFPSTFGPEWAFDSRDMMRALRQNIENFDCVHIAALWQWIGIESAWICRHHNVPITIGIHGGFSTVLRKKGFLKKYFYKLLFLQRTLKFARALYITSQTEIRTSGTWLQNFPYFLCPNGLNADLYYPRPEQREIVRKQYRIPLDSLVLVSAGRPDWKKRTDLLIQAIARNPRWYLVFTGDVSTDYGPKWKQLAAQYRVSDRVIWTGFLDTDSLCNILSAGDLFALVSENENFGNVVAEALYCGLPAAINEDVGIIDYIRDKPFTFVTPKTAEGVYQALLDYEQKRNYPALNKDTIRQDAIQLFCSSAVALQFHKAIESLLAV